MQTGHFMKHRLLFKPIDSQLNTPCRRQKMHGDILKMLYVGSVS